MWVLSAGGLKSFNYTYKSEGIVLSARGLKSFNYTKKGGYCLLEVQKVLTTHKKSEGIVC